MAFRSALGVDIDSPNIKPPLHGTAVVRKEGRSRVYELLKNLCVHTDFPSFYCLSLSVKIQTGSKSKIYASKCKFLIALIILIEHIRRVLAGTSLRKSWDSRLHQCAFLKLFLQTPWSASPRPRGINCTGF